MTVLAHCQPYWHVAWESGTSHQQHVWGPRSVSSTCQKSITRAQWQVLHSWQFLQLKSNSGLYHTTLCTATIKWTLIRILFRVADFFTQQLDMDRNWFGLGLKYIESIIYQYISLVSPVPSYQCQRPGLFFFWVQGKLVRLTCTPIYHSLSI